jgi:HlyD family secretion protein
MCVGVIAGCAGKANEGYLGSAVVECRTYQIATTAQGFLREVYKEEGQRVTTGERIAIIDTVPLTLKRQELLSTLSELDFTIGAKNNEVLSQKANMRGVAREFGRIGDLAEKGSVPMQQKDDLGTKVQVTDLGIKAAEKAVAGLAEKRKTLSFSLAQIDEQLKACFVSAPCNGVVLTRYKNPGEVTAPGAPIIELGAMDSVHIDFFIPQPLLSSINFNDSIHIRLDTSDSKNKKSGIFRKGIIIWISDEAEFTPKNVQTRESRNELVFRVRAVVENNDGSFKRGLPIEVWR